MKNRITSTTGPTTPDRSEVVTLSVPVTSRTRQTPPRFYFGQTIDVLLERQDLDRLTAEGVDRLEVRNVKGLWYVAAVIGTTYKGVRGLLDPSSKFVNSKNFWDLTRENLKSGAIGYTLDPGLVKSDDKVLVRKFKRGEGHYLYSVNNHRMIAPLPGGIPIDGNYLNCTAKNFVPSGVTRDGMTACSPLAEVLLDLPDYDFLVERDLMKGLKINDAGDAEVFDGMYHRWLPLAVVLSRMTGHGVVPSKPNDYRRSQMDY